MRATLSSLLVACAALSLGRPAAAQHHRGRDREREREALLDQAAAAAEHRHHARALDAAERAGAIRMTPAVRRFIAEELVALDRLADGLRAGRLCVHDAELDLMSAHRAEVLRDCRAMVERLERRVGFVVVRLPPNTAPGAQVHVQGLEVPRAQWGEPQPVDPGAVEVMAELGDMRESLRLQVSAGLTRIWEVSLTPPPPPRPHVTPSPAVARESAPVASAPSVAAPVSAPPPATQGRGGPGVGPWLVTGAGGAMLLGALVVLTRYDALRAEQLQHCREDLTAGVRDCLDAQGLDVTERRDTLRALNNALFFGGLAAVVGGVTWYVVARVRHTERPRTAWRLDVAPGAGGASVQLGATF